MQKWLAALFVLFSWSLSAQTLERSFGLELSPQLSESRISGTNSATFSQLERLDSLEHGGFGYGIGLLYESRIDRIGYTTGLRYTRAGYATLEQAAAGGSNTFSDEIAAHYLAIPFDLNFYQDVTEDDRVLFVLGVAVQYHLGTRTERTTFTNGAASDPEVLSNDDIDYRPLITSLTTGIGYDRKLSNDWAIRFQPTFQFFLNGNLRPDATTIANRNYYQVGLRVVVRRLFI
ncbi:outer membrane beta-barrel protein [Lewinella sp. JB7]|uniref:outer membrane beta-barrel protein n=1 Tax=Lewinella sp. JB7 TaxID=2962887 RepID=UPI0020C9FDEB|nr:outer membrane beta-barrel protein [Lewinella sp. JB7]MCP9234932.1 PorT family protein [Lewinella sp. JB7]